MTGCKQRLRQTAGLTPKQCPAVGPRRVIRPAPGSRGFTLVEALIAAAVLSIGILGAVSMIMSATILDKRAHHLTHASLIFEEILENMLRMQLDPAQYRNMTAPSGMVTKDGIPYEVTCSLAADVPLATCTEMTCSISWNTNGRRTETSHAYTFSPK